jgi:hypothetical protein
MAPPMADSLASRVLAMPSHVLVVESRPPFPTAPLSRDELVERVKDLEAANRHLRELAEAERRRADRAEESARVAWTVAARP